MSQHEPKNIYNDIFYFRHLNFPNQVEMENELRKTLTPIFPKTHLTGVLDGFWRMKDVDILLENPYIKNFLDEHDLELSACGIIFTKPWDVHSLHRDGKAPTDSPYALNFGLQNCEKNYVKLYTVLDENYQGEECRIRGNLHFTYREEKCKELFRYNLKKPIVFDSTQLHRVYNYTNNLRISVSLRFSKDPEQLLL